VNANLLRKWVVNYQLESTPAAPHGATDDAANQFVPVVVADRADSAVEKFQVAMPPAVAAGTPPRSAAPFLRAQLPNGVTLEFDCDGSDTVLVCAVIDSLGRYDVPSRR
jgi:transposase